MAMAVDAQAAAISVAEETAKQELQESRETEELPETKGAHDDTPNTLEEDVQQRPSSRDDSDRDTVCLPTCFCLALYRGPDASAHVAQLHHCAHADGTTPQFRTPSKTPLKLDHRGP